MKLPFDIIQSNSKLNDAFLENYMFLVMVSLKCRNTSSFQDIAFRLPSLHTSIYSTSFPLLPTTESPRTSPGPGPGDQEDQEVKHQTTQGPPIPPGTDWTTLIGPDPAKYCALIGGFLIHTCYQSLVKAITKHVRASKMLCLLLFCYVMIGGS